MRTCTCSHNTALLTHTHIHTHTHTHTHTHYSFPGADDNSLFQKFERQHKTHPHYRSPQLKLKDPVFAIVHYASDVTYSIQVKVSSQDPLSLVSHPDHFYWSHTQTPFHSSHTQTPFHSSHTQTPFHSSHTQTIFTGLIPRPLLHECCSHTQTTFT